ncbi:HAD hydrolase-like protein, partial [Butyricicoccus sp.]|uniref:HAD hydrolase-like protein n=1 Tax=Butyricicoccus sp. TaxID=2049021 RepID=UPI003D7E2EF3
ATDHTLVEAALRRVGVLDYFSFILTCGDLQTSKNLPYIFDTCTERLGTDKRTTAVFEDSLHCVITASGAGYPVVGVYDESAKTETEEIRRLSRCFLYNWKELDFDRLEQSL